MCRCQKDTWGLTRASGAWKPRDSMRSTLGASPVLAGGRFCGHSIRGPEPHGCLGGRRGVRWHWAWALGGVDGPQEHSLGEMVTLWAGGTLSSVLRSHGCGWRQALRLPGLRVSVAVGAIPGGRCGSRAGLREWQDVGLDAARAVL